MNLQLFIISVVEGMAEFLPISSTAHLILFSKILNVDTTDSYIKFYLLFIQMGALLAGIIIFSKKLLSDKKLFINICVSFIPSAVLGFIFYKMFKKLLEGDLYIISATLFLGGVIFIYLDKVFIVKHTSKGLYGFGKDNITKMDAFVIGLAQAVAIIPGVSRSGATIIAGILRKIKKEVIIEYTFLLAIPTLGAAVLYDTYKSKDILVHLSSFQDLSVGFATSFVVAFFVLSILKKYISKVHLMYFGWYRIILAVVVLVLIISSGQVKGDISNVVPNTTNEMSSTTEKIYTTPTKLFTVLPEKIFPGDPILITIMASSSPFEVTLDGKKIPTFVYENSPKAFIAIPFEEKKLDHNLQIKLSNGMILNEKIQLLPREQVSKKFGIPEKFGGNTKVASNNLVSQLTTENVSISSTISSPKILWSKAFQLPVESVFVTDQYGYNRDTSGNSITHKGTDFRAPVGTKVLSMNDGIVRIAKKYTVYGNTVIVDHGLGVTTLYMHLSELKVREGDKVVAGQVIGLSGQTGYAEAPHLHVSIKIKGVSVDPIKFMNLFGIINI